MNAKHRKTLEKLFAQPPSATIRWRDIESMLLALGAEMTEGRGSRLRFTLNERTIFVHRPHPAPDTKPYVVRNIREFLKDAGIEP
jgi:hypothetical protein